ncbi:hypothetical protein [uncultured Barnesiella sp.]|uniref:hypothetical protein n=1 Tax=uncultured Barnesiella sp. TaxID=584861 RepID=UPI00259A0BBA|nr:hypothetical protein [uncultured Barnesiella sp.]
MELQVCYEKYKVEFGNEKWSHIDYNDGEACQAFYNKIQDFIEFSFIHLTRSILSGEYIREKNFGEILEKFKQELANIPNPPVGSITTPENRIQLEVFYLGSSLFNALASYESFFFLVRSKYKKADYENSNIWLKRLFRKTDRNSLLETFYNIAIPICQQEYYLLVDEGRAYKILELRSSIEMMAQNTSVGVKEIYTLLLQKTAYILRRVRKEPLRYATSNFKEEITYPKDLDIGDYSLFEKRTNSDKDKIRIAPFVSKMEKYRTSLKNEREIKSMDNLIADFKRVYGAYKSDPKQKKSELEKISDEFSWDSVYNYLYNCRFSFLTRVKKDIKLKEIKEELRVIEDIQAATSIRNFHPYEKAIQSIIDCIQRHIDREDINDHLMEDKFSELERLIPLYKERIKWCKSHTFIAFQLPFEESCVYSEKYELNLFVPSPFVNNDDYDALAKRADSYEQQYKSQKMIYAVTKEKVEIDKIKSSIKNTDKKAFDLIAIFTTAITFLFGIVNIFIMNDEVNLPLLICNTMGLGVLLILFMCLYLLASPILIQQLPWKQYVRTRRFYLGIIAVIIYMGLTCFLYNRFEYIGSKVEEKERTENVEKASEKEIQIQEPNNIQDKLKE